MALAEQARAVAVAAVESAAVVTAMLAAATAAPEAVVVTRATHYVVVKYGVAAVVPAHFGLSSAAVGHHQGHRPSRTHA